jgi:hypothetical protein
MEKIREAPRKVVGVQRVACDVTAAALVRERLP